MAERRYKINSTFKKSATVKLSIAEDQVIMSNTEDSL